MTEEQAAVVIDNGSYMIKAGMAGDDAPRSCFPSLVGKLKFPFAVSDQYIVGDEAASRRNMCDAKSPIKFGIIHDWENMERIWHYIYFNELQVAPEEQPTMISVSPMGPKQQLERITRIMFETFNVPSFYIGNNAIDALYASGRTTGVVVESGDQITSYATCYEGYAGQNTVLTRIAGNNVTKYLSNCIQEIKPHGEEVSQKKYKFIVTDIKEKLCYVHEADFYKFIESSQNNRIYELPDGNSLKLTDQRFRAPEIIFTPEILGLKQLIKINEQNAVGMHQNVFQLINMCDVDLRHDLYNNIVMSGGNTMFPGMSERLSREITQLPPSNKKIKVVAPPERKFSSFIGGSILSSLSTFESLCITRAEYHECGVQIIHKLPKV